MRHETEFIALELELERCRLHIEQLRAERNVAYNSGLETAAVIVIFAKGGDDMLVDSILDMREVVK